MQVRILIGLIATALSPSIVNGLSCNYQGQIFPICLKANAWSYENNSVCVGVTRCVSQDPPYGVTVGTVPPKTSTPVPTTATPQPTTTTRPITPTPTTPTPTTPTPTTTTPRPATNYVMGVDISEVPELISGGATFVDTDGQRKSILSLLKNHGFNYVRLRTFVDPMAKYGYATGDGGAAAGCYAKTESFNDMQHTVAFAKQVKAAGFRFLLDIHYSDTWADPGKQVIPSAWRSVGSIDGLAQQVSQYTTQLLQALKSAGVTPDMVQVGNEITNGMLIHVPTSTTDCWGGNSKASSSPNGGLWVTNGGWQNLGKLLKAGIQAVKNVDSNILIMLHIENTKNVNDVKSWVQNAKSQGIDFDILGLSVYEAFQGPASAWPSTFQTLAQTFPNLKLSVAEYNPQRRYLNDIMKNLPNNQGIGSFFWEPTKSGSWGSSMFDVNSQTKTYTARQSDFAVYDQMKSDYGL